MVLIRHGGVCAVVVTEDSLQVPLSMRTGNRATIHHDLIPQPSDCLKTSKQSLIQTIIKNIVSIFKHEIHTRTR